MGSRGPVGTGLEAEPCQLEQLDRLCLADLSLADLAPAQRVEGLRRERRRQGRPIDRPHADRADAEHLSPRAVEGGNRKRVVVLAGTEAHAQRGGGGRDEAELAPEVGRQRLAVARAGVEANMQSRVQKDGMDGESARFGGLLLGERDLREEILAGPPGAGQALEGGAMVKPDLGEAIVDGVGADRLGTGVAARRRVAQPVVARGGARTPSA